ncbi:MAG: GNAT family N-acetyltransferase [bacterium]|nr:GNAT family N-acetyltransferase [bacterium]
MEIEYKKMDSLDKIDKDKFSDLVKSAFGKQLVDDYFSYCKPKYIIVGQKESEYVGLIAVESIPNSNGLHYLDKIVVSPEFQGNGIGKKLWVLLNGDSTKLIWRSKDNNPINNFYYGQCEGLQKIPPWNIYWYGLNSSELEMGIDYSFSKKPTLEEM